MNKKIMTITLASFMMLSTFAGCGNVGNTDTTKNNGNAVENAADDVKNGAENIGNDVRNGVDNAADDVRNGAENVTDGNDNVTKNASSLTPYQFDYSGMYRQYTSNDTGYYNSSSTAKHKQEGNAAYSEIKKISGISDVKVVIIDNKAYCGVKTEAGANSLSTKKKAKIGNIIKEKYPQVKNVYFSDKVNGYTSLVNVIGNDLRDITDDVLNLFDIR